jgi:hypothetical protein
MSIHPEILELIHAEIDGVASEAELIRLRDAISGDAAVREEYRRLRGLCDILSRVEPAAPPPQLAPSVMRAVRAQGNQFGGKLFSHFRSFWPGGGLAVRYAYAVAAGAVIGILGFHLVVGSGNGPWVPERDARATIAPTQAGGRLDLTPAGVPGFATLKSSPAGTAIGIDLSAKEPVEFLLRYDPAKNGGRVDVLVVRSGEATEAGSLHLTQDN